MALEITHDYMTNRNINIIEKKEFCIFAYHRKASYLCVTFVYTLNNHLYIFMQKKLRLIDCNEIACEIVLPFNLISGVKIDA